MKYNHGEAYALMWYACPCGHRERIWNSRDGVTPFGGLLCTSCGGKGFEKRGLQHVDWKLDQCSPDHKLHKGQQFFRDGTPEEAVDIIRRRIEHFKKHGHDVPDEVVQRLLQDAANTTGEWQKGWPTVDRVK